MSGAWGERGDGGRRGSVRVLLPRPVPTSSLRPLLLPRPGSGERSAGSRAPREPLLVSAAALRARGETRAAGDAGSNRAAAGNSPETGGAKGERRWGSGGEPAGCSCQLSAELRGEGGRGRAHGERAGCVSPSLPAAAPPVSGSAGSVLPPGRRRARDGWRPRRVRVREGKGGGRGRSVTGSGRSTTLRRGGAGFESRSCRLAAYLLGAEFPLGCWTSIKVVLVLCSDRVTCFLKLPQAGGKKKKRYIYMS